MKKTVISILILGFLLFNILQKRKYDGPVTHYTVQSGDTINTIAKKFDVDPDKLMEINNIQISSVIFEGHVLVIPQNSKFKNEITDDLSNVDITSDESIKLYHVQYNDTFKKIGERFKIDPNEIIKINKIKNDKKLYPGLIIKIPKADVTEETKDEK